MSRKKIFETIRLFVGLGALALAASSCAPAGSIANDRPQHSTQVTVAPAIDQEVIDEIESEGSAEVHLRVRPEAFPAAGIDGDQSENELAPQIVKLIEELPQGAFTPTRNIIHQPEALGILSRDGFARLRHDPRVEFIAHDRFDQAIQ